MTLNPIWLQNEDYSAQLDRQLIQGLVSQEGVESPLSFKCEPQSPANMTVNVLAGGVFVQGDNSADQGMYYVRNTDEETSPTLIAPSGGQHRIYTICIAVNDPDASGPSGDDATIEALAGTIVSTATTPTAPTLLDTHYPLADVLVTGGDTSLTAGHITDRRQLCGGMEHIGAIREWAGGAILPNGWVAADGAAYSRATYAEAFEAFGILHGSGDGSTTFNVPDHRGRVAVGSGTGDYSSPVTTRSVGQKGGLQNVTLSESQIPSHFHTINHDHPSVNSSSAGNHTHTYFGGIAFVGSGGNVGGGPSYNTGWTGTSGSSGNHSHSVNLPNYSGNSGSKGGGGAHENMPPYHVVQKIVRIA